MPISIESSFGARYLRAKNLKNYILNLPGFSPPRIDESPAEYSILLDNVNDANTNANNAKQNYNTAVSLRYDAFRNNTNSIFKVLPNIRAATEAQYGKSSIHFKQIDAAIKTIRNTKIIHIAATETTPETTISRSEQSYGSSTQYFANIINNLIQLPNYNPSNPTIKIAGLQAILTNINTLNSQVATAFQAIRASRVARNAAYTELKDRSLRIKAYIKATYGTQSEEYKLVKGLSI
ncbi:MAG: hypothetical protein RI894_2340 [Bacteroidota bacterium]